MRAKPRTFSSNDHCSTLPLAASLDSSTAEPAVAGGAETQPPRTTKTHASPNLGSLRRLEDIRGRIPPKSTRGLFGPNRESAGRATLWLLAEPILGLGAWLAIGWLPAVMMLARGEGKGINRESR